MTCRCRDVLCLLERIVGLLLGDQVVSEEDDTNGALSVSFAGEVVASGSREFSVSSVFVWTTMLKGTLSYGCPYKVPWPRL
jgi:hypothetical protein